jgi:hypothetical protein
MVLPEDHIDHPLGDGREDSDHDGSGDRTKKGTEREPWVSGRVTEDAQEDSHGDL